MHGKSTLALALASSTLVSAVAPEPANPVPEVKPRQTTNPGGPLETVSLPASVTDEGTTGIMSILPDTSSVLLSIQTDTSLTRSETETAPLSSAISSFISSASDALSSIVESSAAVSTSTSDGAAPPRETGFALGAAAAAAIGFAGVAVAL